MMLAVGDTARLVRQERRPSCPHTVDADTEAKLETHIRPHGEVYHSNGSSSYVSNPVADQAAHVNSNSIANIDAHVFTNSDACDQSDSESDFIPVALSHIYSHVPANTIANGKSDNHPYLDADHESYCVADAGANLKSDIRADFATNTEADRKSYFAAHTNTHCESYTFSDCDTDWVAYLVTDIDSNSFPHIYANWNTNVDTNSFTHPHSNNFADHVPNVIAHLESDIVSNSGTYNGTDAGARHLSRALAWETVHRRIPFSWMAQLPGSSLRYGNVD